MPVYAEPVAPLGELYGAPAPRGGATAAADATFAAWWSGLAGVAGTLEAGQGNLGLGDANLASLDVGLAGAEQAWAVAGVYEGLRESQAALEVPNPVGGPTIPLSLTVPNVTGTVSPVAGLGQWLRANGYAYLQQLAGYLYNLGAPPIFVPPWG